MRGSPSRPSASIKAPFNLLGFVHGDGCAVDGMNSTASFLELFGSNVAIVAKRPVEYCQTEMNVALARRETGPSGMMSLHCLCSLKREG